jgi:hypothetical protein
MNESGIDRITRVHYDLTGFGQFGCEQDNGDKESEGSNIRDLDGKQR